MIQIGNDKNKMIAYRGTDDVARAVLGGDWRLPTTDDFKELIDNCSYQLTSSDMFEFRGTNGNTLTMPRRNYWTANCSGAQNAYRCMLKTDGTIDYMSVTPKRFVLKIRAVSNTEGIDLGLPSGLKWANCNLGSIRPMGLGVEYKWGEINPSNDSVWANYKFNPSGDGQTFTKYATDGKRKLELDCICEYERVMEGGDFAFFKPISYSKDFSDENLSLVSAMSVLDALQSPVGGSQTITFSSATSELLLEDDNAIAKIEDLADIGWNIVLN